METFEYFKRQNSKETCSKCESYARELRSLYRLVDELQRKKALAEIKLKALTKAY